jgi:hypothetical protein
VPTPAPAACSLQATPGAVTIRKNGITTGTVTVKAPGASSATSITTQSSSSTNVAVTPASGSVPQNGSAVFSIKSLRNNAGFVYQVKFISTTCGTASVSVTVTN